MNFIILIQKKIKNLTLNILGLIKIILLSKITNFNKFKIKTTEVLILGNGPSLISTVIEKKFFLEGKTLVCVNHFAESDLFKKLKPNIYVLAAPEMWRTDVEDFHLQKGKNLFDKISYRTNWDLKLFIPFCAKKYNYWKSRIEKNSNIEIIYYNNISSEGSSWFRHMAYKTNLAMPRPHNVLIPSLMISLNLGFKYIYIAGADHSWMKEVYVADDNTVFLTQKHFYDYKTAKPNTMDNRGVGRRKMDEILEKWMLAFRGYFIIKEYAKKVKKAEIINITPHSYIDAFDRLKI